MHLEDGPPVQGEPAPVGGLDFVGDQHVRVQVRVAASGVKMGELGGDDPAGFDLFDTSGPDPGVDGVVLGPRQGFGDGFVMQRGDVGGGVLVGQCPPDADTFHRREREIESGDGLFDAVAFPVDPGDDVFPGGVLVAELLGVERAGRTFGDLASFLDGGAPSFDGEEGFLGSSNSLKDLDAAGVDRETSAQLAGREGGAVGHLLVGVRVQSLPVQGGHLFLGHGGPDGRGLGVQSGQSGADPDPRWGAFGGVVVRQ